MSKTPEEIAALKAKYGDNSNKKAAKKAKKAQYENVNIPAVEMFIPWIWNDEPSNGPIRGKEIDLELPRNQEWLDALEWGWRCSQAMRAETYPHNIYMGPVKRKIIRT